MSNNKVFFNGIRDGFPIGLGYFAVAFSMGIMAGKAGLSAFTGFLSSLLIRASAGEYGGYSMILIDATYVEVFTISVVTNLRYLLMNTALSQKFDPKTSIFHRIFVGCCCTDEIFAISIGYKEKYLNPIYPYAATLIAGPMWASGTALGIIAGNVLPLRLVSALSVALYGMFLAIIVPAGKKDKAVLAAIIASFIASFACAHLPVVSLLSSGTRTIVLTIVIAALAAVIKPIPKDDEEEEIGQEG